MTVTVAYGTLAFGSESCEKRGRNGFDLGKDGMPTYVMLTTLTPEGVQTLKNNPKRVLEVNKEIEQLGAEVKAQYAVLGQYDFVNVIEAPDEQTMARVSLELGSRGTARYESLAAIPVDEFIESI
ncbi:MAG: GYD domain-containing protein [Thermoleophilaceae bacterium]